MKDFNDNELIDFVNLTKDRPLDVRFIEYMPFSGNQWNTDKMVSFSEMKQIICSEYPNFSKFENKYNDTSKVIYSSLNNFFLFQIFHIYL